MQLAVTSPWRLPVQARSGVSSLSGRSWAPCACHRGCPAARGRSQPEAPSPSRTPGGPCFRLPDPCQCATISTVTLRLTYYRPAASIETPHFPLALARHLGQYAPFLPVELEPSRNSTPSLSRISFRSQVCQFESLLDRWTHRYQIQVGKLFGSSSSCLLFSGLGLTGQRQSTG